jgi:hypothetical protein
MHGSSAARFHGKLKVRVQVRIRCAPSSQPGGISELRVQLGGKAAEDLERSMRCING